MFNLHKRGAQVAESSWGLVSADEEVKKMLGLKKKEISGWKINECISWMNWKSNAKCKGNATCKDIAQCKNE